MKIRAWGAAWLLGACASAPEASNEALFGDRPWLIDYRVEAKDGTSHLRVFENGERLLVEEICCPKRRVAPTLSPLDADDLSTYREMIRLAIKEGLGSRLQDRRDLKAGTLQVRMHGQSVVLRRLERGAGDIGRFEFNDSDATGLLLDEIESDLTWTLPR